MTGTNRGSTKKHTDTLAVTDRDTVHDYDNVRVTNRNVSQQNQPYELMPSDYLRPSISSNKKEYAETDYYVTMQSKGSVHDSGQLYEEFSHDKAFTKPPVNEAVSINCSHIAGHAVSIAFSTPNDTGCG